MVEVHGRVVVALVWAIAAGASAGAVQPMTTGRKTMFFAIDMTNEQIIDGCTVLQELALNLSSTISLSEDGNSTVREKTDIVYTILRTSDSGTCIVPFEESVFTATTNNLVGYTFDKELSQASLLATVPLTAKPGNMVFPETVVMTTDVYFKPKNKVVSLRRNKRTVFFRDDNERLEVSSKTKKTTFEMTKNLAGLFGVNGKEPWKFGRGQNVALTAVLDLFITYENEVKAPTAFFESGK